MKLSKNAILLLKKVAKSDDYSTPLTNQNKKAAQELVNENLAVLIPKAKGGAEIALTTKGIDLMN